MVKWYVIESLDNQKIIDVFDSLDEVRTIYGSLKRGMNGLYRKDRMYIGTKNRLKNEGFNFKGCYK